MAWVPVNNARELAKLNAGESPNNHPGQSLGDADPATPVDDNWTINRPRDRYQTRSRKFKEITNDLKYTGTGGATDLVQEWDRCSPGTTPQILVKPEPFPVAIVVDPINDVNPPDKMKSRRTGKLHVGGYTVKGSIYRREFTRTEQRIRRDPKARWSDWFLRSEVTTGWERQNPDTNETHSIALIKWGDWESVSCPRGRTREVGFFEDELLAAASVFEVFSDEAGEFRFRLKAANGEIVAASEGYTTKASAFDGVEAVVRAAATADVVDTSTRRKARKPAGRTKNKPKKRS